jgi:hypothetical protein
MLYCSDRPPFHWFDVPLLYSVSPLSGSVPVTFRPFPAIW